MVLKKKSVFRIPFHLIVVVVGLLLASLQGWIRLVLSLSNWTIYESIGVQPGVWYLAASGFFTGIVYLLAVFFILSPQRNIKNSSTFILIGMAGYWFDRIFAVTSLEARTLLPFALVSSAGLSTAAIGILYWDTIVRKVLKQEK